MGIRYCPKCGSRAEDGDVFCIYCGTKLASGGAAPSTTRPSGTASVTMGGSDAASMEYEYENGYLQFRGLYGGGYDASDPVPCKIKGKTMIWSDPYTGEEVTFKKD